MDDLTDLEKLKLAYHLIVKSILVLAFFLATYMMWLQIQDSRQVKQVAKQLNLDAGDGL